MSTKHLRFVAFASRVACSPAVWGIAAIVAAAWLIVTKSNYESHSEVLLQHSGFAAIAPLILVHAIVAVSPFPGEVIALHNSMLFGFVLGAWCNWCGWMLASIIQYALAQRGARDLGFQRSDVVARMPGWMRGLPLEHPAFLIGGRWIPFGGHLVNTVAGVTSVSFWRHLWCAAVSIIPVALLFAALGHGWTVWF